MIRNVGKMTMLSLAFSGLASLAGCGQRGADPSTTAISGQGDTGSITAALSLSGGGTINSASYMITGPNGFTKNGTVDVSSSTKLSATIGGLPAGMGYSITLTASTVDGATTCGGSATFNVAAHNTVAVNVPMTCHEPARNGSVFVSGVLNICPTADGIAANPGEVAVGGTIQLSANAHDSDAGPNALTYAWQATGGTLSDATAQNPTFTCGSTPGTANITLTVSDGDPAASCADTLTAQVTCTVAAKAPGTYVVGDFHNHTTCSDGSISMEKLIKKATDRNETPWGLDWFVQAGHGGNGNRNCQLVEDASLATPVYGFVPGAPPTGQTIPNTTWVSSGITPKGDVSGSGANRNMWRWQSIQEFQYQLVEYFSAFNPFNFPKSVPLFIGVETVNPGHEHTSMSIVTGQMPASLDTATAPTGPNATPLPGGPPYTALGNANALAQWEYCFDRNDTDKSRGATNMWDCTNPASPGSTDPMTGWDPVAMKLIPTGTTGVGTKGHAKAVESLKWMAQFHPDTSYYAPAHLERAGVFNPDGNFGFNVESLRDFNNAAPKVAFGFESQPGHGASSNRGEYQVKRNNFGTSANPNLVDSVGGTTYGGTGIYAGQIGGVWDSLLGEGRNWWFFASSDWHTRNFGPDDRRTTQDFYPGEYQRNYTMVRAGSAKARPQQIVDGLRSGNNFATGGQLIDRLGFVACVGKSDAQVGQIAANAAMKNVSPEAAGCATMGEKLNVTSGADVVIGIAVRDPEGTNFSPYTFENPSLLQIPIHQAINKPVLDHVDLIGGLVSGYRTPGAPDYAGEWPRNTAWLHADGTTPPDLSGVPDAAKNVTAALLKTFNGAGASAWTPVTSFVDGSKFLVMTFRVPAVTASRYFRLRGTNMPPAVPFETDASGNPLADIYTNNNDPTMLRIPCTIPHSAMSQFDGCPDHMGTASGASPIAGTKAVSFDVAAWSDLWFYANPIYIQVTGGVVVAGVQ